MCLIKSHLRPSKTPTKAAVKNCFFVISYPYPQSGARTIYDCMRPSPRKGYLMPKKWFLKGALKLKGVLINDSGHSDIVFKVLFFNAKMIYVLYKYVNTIFCRSKVKRSKGTALFLVVNIVIVYKFFHENYQH